MTGPPLRPADRGPLTRRAPDRGPQAWRLMRVRLPGIMREVGMQRIRVEASRTMSTEDLHDQLTELPLRAIVAFAVRCARRVQPLGHVLTEYRQVEVEDAIASAEGFARGGKAVRAAGAAARAANAARAAARAVDAARAAAAKAAADSDWVDADDAEAADAWAEAPVRAADAAACAARAANAARAADIAAADASAAGADADTARAAWDTGRDAARDAARGDLHRLRALDLGRPGTLGKPIDPAEDGPLGPLWLDGAPDWYAHPPTPSDPPNPPTLDLED